MNNQETVMLDQITEALNQNMARIYASLEGKELCAETLAAAMAQLCPDASAQELEKDCRSLLEGIHSGTAFAQNLLNMPEEELAKVFPDQIRGALEQMNPDQQRQHLIMLYQYLSQSVGNTISRDEAISIANTSTEELFHKICDLGQYAQAEITSETANVFHENLRQVAANPLPEGAEQYTQEERIWVLSAAMYAQARENNPEKVPATLLGEVAGMSSTAAGAFREKMLNHVIPAAVGVLAVVAVGTLVFLGIKALMGCSLFASVMSWMTARVNPAVLAALCAAYLMEPIDILIEEIYQTAYTATASFTARFLRDEAREAYLRSTPVLLPGEGITGVTQTIQPVCEYPGVPVQIPVEYEGSGYIREDDTVTDVDEEEDCY